MTHTAIEVPTKTASEVLNAAVSMSAKLADGEVLIGTPTVVEVGTSDLTLSSKVISTVAQDISGVNVPVGEAIQFSVSGGSVNTLYTINVSCQTTSNPPQTIHGKVTFHVEAD